MRKYLISLGIITAFSGCQPNCDRIEPSICYVPQARQIQNLPSPFDKLNKEELRQEWAKELYVGLVFANEMDLYRAITALKRALIFVPPTKIDRKLQIQYNICLCYYLGQKHVEVIETFNASDLPNVSNTFPAFRELMIMLYDCYQKTKQCEKAENILMLIQEYDPEAYSQLNLSTAFEKGDLGSIESLSSDHCKAIVFDAFLDLYQGHSKSVAKARALNAILPGAGYYYVGLKKAAMTSFLINSLFIGAAYYFFKNDNIPAGLITTSLETGWYVGGINGAGLAAKEYNERLFEVNGKEVMMQTCLFPILMFKKSF